jgi:hypothetical protein
MPAGSARFRVPRRSRSGLFPCPTRPHHRLTALGSAPLQSLTMSAAAPRLSTGATYPGFVPSSRRHPRASTSPSASLPPAGVRPLRTGHPKSRYVPSSGFETPRRFSPRAGFAGLLHPATTSRACSCPRASTPSAAGALSSRAPCPLAVVRPRLIDRSRPPAGSDLGFEALLRRWIRTISRPFVPSSGSVLLQASQRCRQ